MTKSRGRAPWSYPTLEELAGDLAELRPLSPVALQVVELSEDERFSAHELAALIASDPALTARMLRLANSAYYGFPRQISTVRDAVVLLGFRAVRSTALATCLIGSMPRGRSIDEARFWQFSVGVGLLAELLARTEGGSTEEAFTAGVLHNIGRLALDQRAPEALQQAATYAQEHGVTLPEAERALLGFADSEIGGALCERWHLPQALVEAVGGHQLDPSELPPAGSTTAAVVRARVFARSAGLSDGIEQPATEIEGDSLVERVARRRRSPSHSSAPAASRAYSSG